jgi:hypothetical protein
MRMLPGVIFVAAFCFLQLATISTARAENSHEGVVVSAGMNKLTMKTTQGAQQSHTIDADTKVTVNGKPGKLEDLTMGMRIVVILNDDNKVLSVSTVDKEKDPSDSDNAFR